MLVYNRATPESAIFSSRHGQSILFPCFLPSAWILDWNYVFVSFDSAIDHQEMWKLQADGRPELTASWNRSFIAFQFSLTFSVPSLLNSVLLILNYSFMIENERPLSSSKIPTTTGETEQVIPTRQR